MKKKIRLSYLHLVLIAYLAALIASGCGPHTGMPLRRQYPDSLAVNEVYRIIPRIGKSRVFGHFTAMKYGVSEDFVIIADTNTIKFFPLGPLVNTPVLLNDALFPEIKLLLVDTPKVIVDSAFSGASDEEIEIYGKVDVFKFKAKFRKGLPQKAVVSDNLEVEFSSFKAAGTDRFYPQHVVIRSHKFGVIDARIDSIIKTPISSK